MRNEYLGYFVRQCHMTPLDVDAIGWLDLAGLSLMCDDEVEAHAAQMKH